MFSLEINYQTKVPHNFEALFKQLGRQTLTLLKIRRSMAVSLVFISPAVMQKVNHLYRHKNKVTDVLSFEGLNELLICHSRAVTQAKERGHLVKKELSILFVHGLLHLLGYEDETDRGAKKMAILVEKVLSKKRPG